MAASYETSALLQCDHCCPIICSRQDIHKYCSINEKKKIRTLQSVNFINWERNLKHAGSQLRSALS